MEQETKTAILRYLVAFLVACGIVVVVLAMRGFFQTSAKENMRLLHDAFFAAGALMMLFSGLLYVSGEGAFLGIGYAVGRAVKALIPFSKKEHETYAQYRERKLGKGKKKGDACIFFTGLFFFLISVVFVIIWYQL